MVAKIDFNQDRFQTSSLHQVWGVPEEAEELNTRRVKKLEVAGIEHNALWINLAKANPVGVTTPICHERILSWIGGAR